MAKCVCQHNSGLRAPPCGLLAAPIFGFAAMPLGSGRSGANKKPMHIRVAAAVAWAAANEELGQDADETQIARRAGELFTEKHPGTVVRAAAFCKKWGKALEESGGVMDGERQGRHPKVTQAAAVAASKLLKKGHKPGQPEQGYTSLKKACAHDPALEAIRVNDCKGASHRTMLKHMKKYDPHLRVTQVRIKPPVSHKNRGERADTSRWNLQKFRTERSFFRQGAALPLWHTWPAPASSALCRLALLLLLLALAVCLYWSTGMPANLWLVYHVSWLSSCMPA